MHLHVEAKSCMLWLGLWIGLGRCYFNIKALALKNWDTKFRNLCKPSPYLVGGRISLVSVVTGVYMDYLTMWVKEKFIGYLKNSSDVSLAWRGKYFDIFTGRFIAVMGKIDHLKSYIVATGLFLWERNN